MTARNTMRNFSPITFPFSSSLCIQPRRRQGKRRRNLLGLLAGFVLGSVCSYTLLHTRRWNGSQMQFHLHVLQRHNVSQKEFIKAQCRSEAQAEERADYVQFVKASWDCSSLFLQNEMFAVLVIYLNISEILGIIRC